MSLEEVGEYYGGGGEVNSAAAGRAKYRFTPSRQPKSGRQKRAVHHTMVLLEKKLKLAIWSICCSE